ncbi:hypothetical protein [Hungatella effluvii]|uniref:hypothetical protein n=1 Tax=Hungatella effluvii TaxID=1096246 RepID=UPI0022E93129|nr:hypothetical protein [Hungatella effluvii]
MLEIYSNRKDFVSNEKAPQSPKGKRRFFGLFYSVFGICLLELFAASLHPHEGGAVVSPGLSTFPHFVSRGSIKGETVNSLTGDCQQMSK